MMIHIAFSTLESRMHSLSRMINLETILSNSKIKYSIQTELSKMIRARTSQLWTLIKRRHLIRSKKETGILETKIRLFLKNQK